MHAAVRKVPDQILAALPEQLQPCSRCHCVGFVFAERLGQQMRFFFRMIQQRYSQQSIGDRAFDQFRRFSDCRCRTQPADRPGSRIAFGILPRSIQQHGRQSRDGLLIIQRHQSFTGQSQGDNCFERNSQPGSPEVTCRHTLPPSQCGFNDNSLRITASRRDLQQIVCGIFHIPLGQSERTGMANIFVFRVLHNGFQGLRRAADVSQFLPSDPGQRQRRNFLNLSVRGLTQDSLKMWHQPVILRRQDLRRKQHRFQVHAQRQLPKSHDLRDVELSQPRA